MKPTICLCPLMKLPNIASTTKKKRYMETCRHFSRKAKFEFSQNVFAEFNEFSDNSYCKTEIIRICNLLCKRPRCYHTKNRQQTIRGRSSIPQRRLQPQSRGSRQPNIRPKFLENLQENEDIWTKEMHPKFYYVNPPTQDPWIGSNSCFTKFTEFPVNFGKTPMTQKVSLVYHNLQRAKFFRYSHESTSPPDCCTKSLTKRYTIGIKRNLFSMSWRHLHVLYF